MTNQILSYGRQILLLSILITMGSSLRAQPGSEGLQTTISVMPMYQSWSVGDTLTVSQFTTLVSLQQPIGDATGITLRAMPATTGGDPARLSGVADMQLGMSHSLTDARLAFSLSVNLPTGKKELTSEEFATSLLLSTPGLSWHTPSFGQGFNLQGGVVWAIPFTEDFVGGLGVAYQYKGGYTALRDYDEFDPGDEVSITGGIDIQLAEATNFSTDILFTRYGSDKLGPDEVFHAGSKVVVSAQFAKALGPNGLKILARYRTKGKGEVAFAGGLVAEDEKTEPDQLEFLGTYSLFLSDRFTVSFGIDGKVHSETPAVMSGVKLIGVHVSPEIKLSSASSLMVQGRYLTGSARNDLSLSGVEAGVGVRFGL